MPDIKDIWIKTGYDIVALNGLSGLKVETLAKKVGISKSSFYHHFADPEIFMEHVLHYHIQQSYIIAKKEQQASTIFPELIDILVVHNMDLLFNRQLRINREQERFSHTLRLSNEIVGNAFVLVWVKDLNLQLTQNQLEGIFNLALENFYLQINLSNLNEQWLSEYFNILKKVITSFA